MSTAPIKSTHPLIPPIASYDEYEVKSPSDDERWEHRHAPLPPEASPPPLLDFPPTIPSPFTMRLSAAPYEYAILSKHAYRDDIEVGDPVEINNAHKLEEWTVLKILRDKEGTFSKCFKALGFPYGYRGTLYINKKRRQLVLAHRGTDLANIDADITNIISIASNIILLGQERLLPDLLSQAIKEGRKRNYSIATTGHSLGGWLAQITTYIAKDLYPETHVKAVTFDTPGALPMLEQINARVAPVPLQRLDITNYLSSPNLINSCNQHIGTVYRVIFQKFTTPLNDNASFLKRLSRDIQDYALYTLCHSHAMDNFLEAFNPKTGKPKKFRLMSDWPILSLGNLKVNDVLSLGSLTNVATINKVKAIAYALFFLTKSVQGEGLGEYSGFFRFAKKVNSYAIEENQMEGKDRFDLRYKYHYKINPKRNSLSTRHLPPYAFYFLENIDRSFPPFLHAEKEIKALKWDRRNNQILSSSGDVSLIVDKLCHIALRYPELCTPSSIGSSVQARILTPLPPLSPFFTGRDQLISSLKKSFERNPLVIAPPLTGPGGIGKSQLALAIIQSQAKKGHYDYILYIPAETEDKIISAYLNFADSLEIGIGEPLAEKRLALVKHHLANSCCLYLFDDAPSSKSIRDYLPTSQGHVLITSRNSRVEDWDQKPSYLKPFSRQEALILAEQFGYPKTDSLDSLLSILPHYPLALTCIFSTLQQGGYSLEEFTKNLKKDRTLLDILSKDPHSRIGYNRAMVNVIKNDLKKIQNNHAVSLLGVCAYLDPTGIPFDWILTFASTDKSPLKEQTRAALSLLEKYSLIKWDREEKKIYLHAMVQSIIRQLLPKPSFQAIIDSFWKHTGSRKEVFKNRPKWESLSAHALTLFPHLESKTHFDELTSLGRWIEEVYDAKCLFSDALKWAKENLKRMQERYGEQDHPAVAQSLSNVGYGLDKMGEFKEALEYYRKALKMLESIHKGIDHPAVATSLSNVGVGLAQMGELEEALKHCKQSVVMTLLIHKKEHPDLNLHLNNFVSLVNRINNRKLVSKEKEEVLLLISQILGKRHPLTMKIIKSGVSSAKIVKSEDSSTCLVM